MITRGYKVVSVGEDGVQRSMTTHLLPAELIQTYEPGVLHENHDQPFFTFDTLASAKREVDLNRRAGWNNDALEIWECSGEFYYPEEVFSLYTWSRIPLPRAGYTILRHFWQIVNRGQTPYIHIDDRRILPDGTIFAKKIKLERVVA